jgi:putative transposase
MVEALRRDGVRVGRHRVRRLMHRMGLEALAPKPGTSRPAPGHRIYPYRLRGVTIERPNQVWAADITYIPMARGFLYLVAIIDWFSRAVLAWRLSNTMDAMFCIEALEVALARFGEPEIFNTDQGAQFTCAFFTGRLEAAGIAISMDGRGRWLDNVFIERLWRSLKYEEVHLKAYADGREARAGIGGCLLQQSPPSPGAGLPDADGGLARRPGPGCGHAAALGQRWHVAHMRIAATATTSDLGLTEAGNGAGFHLERPIPWPQQPGPPLIARCNKAS